MLPDNSKLHLGCGNVILDGYLNIDYPRDQRPLKDQKPDIETDLVELDYGKDHLQEIRSHHVFEHFSRPVALGLVYRWADSLVIGGKLVIEVPDIEGCFREWETADYARKCILLRHLSGSHEAGWAYHLEQYFPERTKILFEAFGMKCVITHPRTYRLPNLLATCVKLVSPNLKIGPSLLKPMALSGEGNLLQLWEKEYYRVATLER